jgi:hypothetical protein
VTRVRLRRIFWIGAAAILVAAALVALAAVLRGEFTDNDGRILVTLGALLYTGGAALAGLALVDQRRARLVGWIVAGTAPATLALVSFGIWSFAWEEEGNETADKLAWSSVILLLAGLLATTSLLLARTPKLLRLAAGAGTLAVLAAVLSVAGVWLEPDADAYVKVVAVAWILAGLAYFLVPVLQRFSSVGVEDTPERVLDELDGIQLVAVRGRPGIEPRLAPGERLELRRVPTR